MIATDTLYPRDAEHRYRLYARDDDGLYVLATADSPAGIGLAITEIHRDQKQIGRRLADLGMVGILDVLPDDTVAHPAGEWIVLPWTRPSGAVS